MTATSHHNAEDRAESDRLLEQWSELAPEEFFARFLELIAADLGALRGEVWGLSPSGLLAIIARSGDPIDASDAPEHQRRRAQRLQQTLFGRQPMIHSPDDASQSAGGPSLLAPLHQGENTIGVVEVQFDASAEALSTKLERLMERAQAASRYLTRLHRATSPVAGEQRLRQLDAFLLQLNRQTTPREVARTAANETRRVLGCDRVAIAEARGGESVEILAISGQDEIQGRANLTAAMTRLAAQSLRTGRTIHLSDSTDALPAPLEKALLQYLHESGACGLICLPLSDSRQADDDAVETADSTTTPVGVMVVEQFDANQRVINNGEVERIARHVAQALQRARERQRTWLLPARRRIGEWMAWASEDNWRRSIVAAMVVSALLATLAFTPAPNRVKARGYLMPAVQRRVFAPNDGEVVEILVRDGQRVEIGRPLVQLRNDKLALHVLTTRGELQEKRQSLAALEAQENESLRDADAAEQIRLRGRVAQTRIEVESLRQQLAELERQQEQLTVRADIDGVVSTFRLREILEGRPVNRGDLLMELVDPNKAWQVELEAPAHRVGRLTAAQRENRQAPVQFVLATAPENTCVGRLSKIATRAEAASNGEATIGLIAAVDKVSDPVVGAEVIAKIDCGRTSLAYALFGDVVDSIRRHIW